MAFYEKLLSDGLVPFFTFLDPRMSKVQFWDDFSDDNIDEHYLDRARVVLGEATDFIGLKGLYKSLKNNKS